MEVAEAGASSAYVKLLDDLSLTNSPGLLSTNFWGGDYIVSTSIPAENILVITSVGTFGKETGIVGLNLEIDPDANDFDIYETKAGDAPCAIVADGKVSLLGNSDIDLGTNGQAHSNTELTAGGSSVLIAAKISATGDVDVNEKKIPDGVAIESNADYMELPEFLPGPFERVAISNNMTFTEKQFSKLADGVLTSVPGGIVFVNGDCSIGTGTLINGMIVATGNITIHGTVDAPEGLPSVISLNGDIQVNAQAAILSDGWIYATKGNIGLNGGALGGGAIMAGGEIRITGSYALDIDNLENPEYPDGGATNDDAGLDKPALFLMAWSR